MAQDFDPLKLSSPRIFVFRMLVFLVLCGLLVVILNRLLWRPLYRWAETRFRLD